MKNVILVLFLIVAQFVVAQPDSLYFKPKAQTVAGPKWTQENKASFDLSEVAFVNWNSGGSNSITALLGIASILNYEQNHFKWKNTANIRYGINRQQEQDLRKTEDLFELSSAVSYRRDTLSNWFFSGGFNFKTQITNGYNYPDKKQPISQFMAPGYLYFGGGAEYGKNIETFSCYLSPLTFKSTFVLDDYLANLGSFGVTPAVYDDDGNMIKEGEHVRTEMGILVTNSYQTTLFENVSVVNQVSLYTDYLNSFGNLDVDWEVVFDFKVNSYMRATLGSHLKYDNDVKTYVATEIEDEFDERGAKVQWKQLLGVGVVVDF